MRPLAASYPLTDDEATGDVTTMLRPSRASAIA
jgi:hypothetical protein